MAAIQLKNKTLVAILQQSKDLFGKKIFIKYYREDRFMDISFEDFADEASRIGKGLIAKGLKKGDRVAILSENRPEWAVSYLGVLCAGGINVPLDALLKISAWSHIIRSSGARILIISKSFLPEFEQISDELALDHIICMEKPEAGSAALAFSLIEEIGSNHAGDTPRIKPDDLAAILYTSGTTGQAKGVMLSHENIVSDIDGMLAMIDIQPNDRFLSVLPMHHTFECTCGFLTPLAGGASIAYGRGLASKLIIEDIRSNNCTVLLGVPLLFEKMHAGIFRAIAKKPPFTRLMFNASYLVSRLLSGLLGADVGKSIFRGLREKAGLSSLRLLVTGGAPMPPEVSRAFNLLGFTFVQGYGLTEAAPVLTINPLGRFKDASIGLPLPSVELKVVATDSRGIGQLIARGPMVMRGYYENPEATEEVLKDGWLYTGDSGWVDEEGYFYIAGRVKNVIVTPAGKNVFPEEIEGELNKSPYILESLVLGRPLEGTRGDEIEAVVVPDYEFFDAVAAEQGVSFATGDIERIVRNEVYRLSSGLAEFKKVKYIQIREEEFEKTSTRKIKRYLFTQKSEPVFLKVGKGRI